MLRLAEPQCYVEEVSKVDIGRGAIGDAVEVVRFVGDRWSLCPQAHERGPVHNAADGLLTAVVDGQAQQALLSKLVPMG